MTALIVVEAAAIVLLGVLVVGLLKSHAEILRQLHVLGGRRGEEVRHPVPVDLAVGGSTGAPAHDLAGETPGGEAAAVAVAGAADNTVLAFLSSGCLTCAGFWEAMGPGGELRLPAQTRVVAVTKGPEDESVAAVRALAPPGRTVVMSTQAWLDYEVPGSPYFVHVSGATGRVVGEGTAATWAQVASLVNRAHDDAQATTSTSAARPGTPADGPRGARIDQELMAAGIHPGDPRLYPTSPPVAGDDE
ncbi:MAG: hypothetical protein QOD63_461 [Actinomycetota bacterium]|nr:hypothetical protein [Actinomycetota bacterium]